MKKSIVLTLTGLMIMTQSITVFAGNSQAIEPFQEVAAVDIKLVSTSNEEARNIYLKDDLIKLDDVTMRVNGVFMMPLKPILDKAGYKVTWNADLRTVEISKGAQYTSLKIDDNSYFKNKMAPKALSSSPVIINNRTYVPIEFFSDILEWGMTVENREIKFDLNDTMAIHEGYVQSIEKDDKGTTKIVLSSKEKTEGIEDQIIVHADIESYTIYNRSVDVGDYIKVLSPPIMTLSLPGQASGYVIY